MTSNMIFVIEKMPSIIVLHDLGVVCDTSRYMPKQMDIYTYIQIQIHTGQYIKRHTEYTHI
jgi:hypothetical protein